MEPEPAGDTRPHVAGWLPTLLHPEYSAEPEAAELPKPSLGSLVSFGTDFGSKSAVVYAVKYASKVPESLHLPSLPCE